MGFQQVYGSCCHTKPCGHFFFSNQKFFPIKNFFPIQSNPIQKLLIGKKIFDWKIFLIGNFFLVGKSF